MKPFERFFGQFRDLPSPFLSKLDRNFTRLALETTPVATSVNNYTFKTDDTVDSLQVDATLAAKTVYLPDQPVGNRRRRVIKTDSTANTVTIDGNGNLINGASTYVLASQYDRLWVEPTGTGWLIIN